MANITRSAVRPVRSGGRDRLVLFREPGGEAAQPAVGRRTHRPGPLAEHLAGRLGVEPHDRPQKYRLGLVAGQRGDQLQGRLGRHRLQGEPGRVVVADEAHELFDGRGHRRPPPLVAQVVQRTVPADGGRPATEPVAVAVERVQIPDHL